MRKFNAANERIKRDYEQYLRDAKGQDETSIDKVRAALVKFEDSTQFKPFKAFHIDQARHFKDALSRAKNGHGKPLALTTTDATLRLVKAFFHWLAGQQGFKKVVSYADVEYFNNNRKAARAAHTQRPVHYPSKLAYYHAFQAMPNQTDLERRDKAIFAFLILTGARIGAVSSLRLKHVNLVDGVVNQDGREVRTKGGKTIKTWFFPMHPHYLVCFAAWVEYLRSAKLFGPEDALFPRPERRLVNGKFVFDTLSREIYANGSKINEVFKNAFMQVQMHPYGAHSVRRTLVQEMNDKNLTLAEQKAWSQNLGHENFTTTVSSYLPVSEQEQGAMIKGLASE